MNTLFNYLMENGIHDLETLEDADSARKNLEQMQQQNHRKQEQEI